MILEEKKRRRGKRRRGDKEEQQQLMFVDHLLSDKHTGFLQQSHFTDKNTKACKSFTACPRSIKLLGVRGGPETQISDSQPTPLHC